MRLYFAFVFFCLSSGIVFTAQAQTPISLNNASFEDMPRHSHPPRGWYDCGFRGESPPDVQPSGAFGVTKPAVDGNSYLGMVVRDNDTWERVSQPMSRPMEAGKCYEFSIYLCRSELYVSSSRTTDESANYTTPAKLRIYGGFDYCDKAFLLGETNLVINTRWLEYQFKFEPTGNFTHITFEAFYKTPTLFPYNGNLLIDNASVIAPIPCEEEEVVVEEPEPEVEGDPVEEVVAPPVIVEENNPQEENTTRGPVPEPEEELEVLPDVVEEIDFSSIDRSQLREGQTIRTNEIYFEADRSVIQDASDERLDDIYLFLVQNPDVYIEVGGHTNGLPPPEYCDELSTQRAKAVADYLVSKGILRERVSYKGYGKRQPIATNETLEGRRKNQRVEIKILRIN